jgi:hypothetical protein
MGKLTISMAIFHVAFCMFTRPGSQICLAKVDAKKSENALSITFFCGLIHYNGFTMNGIIIINSKPIIVILSINYKLYGL